MWLLCLGWKHRSSALHEEERLTGRETKSTQGKAKGPVESPEEAGPRPSSSNWQHMRDLILELVNSDCTVPQIFHLFQ